MDTVIKLNKQEEHILLHSLGIADIRWYEKDKITNPYRNYFYTSKDGTDYPYIKSLIDKALMEDSGRGWENNSSYFYVTDEGKSLAMDIAFRRLKESKPSKSKRRYEIYLHSEACEKFGDWLKNHYWDDYRGQYGV